MITFHKYQGAGNDFIILDQRQEQDVLPAHKAKIAHWCDRRFGIGADGLITLEKDPELDFAMRYYNADGGEGSLCGNGGRCIVAFAKRQGIIAQACRFRAVDGEHKARMLEDGQVALQMHDVRDLERVGDSFFLDTGSPHYVRLVSDAFDLDVPTEGRKIRYNERFKAKGTNVNFISQEPGAGIRIATYERGVEDETLACGTGVTAAALVFHAKNKEDQMGSFEIPVKAKGGDLSVRFYSNGKGLFSDIWLIGPAQHVFSGQISTGTTLG